MAKSLVNKNAQFGTLPVLLTAIFTILGAILFLRFGWAVGQVGFLGAIGIIVPEHPDWKKGYIKIYALYPEKAMDEKRKQWMELIKTGRLPISPSNILMVPYEVDDRKSIIVQYSADADLTMIGFNEEMLKDTNEFISGYQDLGNILFVNANKAKSYKLIRPLSR